MGLQACVAGQQPVYLDRHAAGGGATGGQVAIRPREGEKMTGKIPDRHDETDGCGAEG